MSVVPIKGQVCPKAPCLKPKICTPLPTYFPPRVLGRILLRASSCRGRSRSTSRRRSSGSSRTSSASRSCRSDSFWQEI
jgi:hypothetical protein